MAPTKSNEPINEIELAKAGQELRQKFFDWYDVNSNEFDEADLKRLRESDTYCQRFIFHRHTLDGDYSRSMEMIKNVFKWRKEFGANNLKESDFSDDFTKSESFYPYRKDKNGNVTVMFRVKKHFKDSKKSETHKKFIVHTFEKIEKTFGYNKRITFIFDCSGAGISNIDLDLVFFIQTVCLKNYPAVLAYVIVYNMPWLFNAAWKIIKSWLPQRAVERIIFTTEKTVYDHIDAADLPEYMGGLDKTIFPLEDTDPMSILPESLFTEQSKLVDAVVAK